MRKANQVQQERGTLKNFIRRCWKTNNEEHFNSSNHFPQAEQDNEESNRFYSQKIFSSQPYMKMYQCEHKAKSTGSVDSHDSTEERADQGENKQDKDLNIGLDACKRNQIPNIQFDYFERQEHEISTCSEEDIEIEEKIVGMSQSKIKINEQMIQQYPQRVEEQHIIEEELVQQEHNRNYLEDNQDVGGLVPFGPPNISDLSTNFSINSHRQDYDLLDNQPNNIFIENQDNILDHLSQLSTRPCMSHLEESNHSARANARVLTDEDYEAILAKAEVTKNRWENVHINTVSETAINYISLMTKFLEGELGTSLSVRQREEFWSIMAFMRRASPHSQAYLQSLNNFIVQFQHSQTNLQQIYWIEYELIKERTECFNAMNCILHQQSNE